MTLELSQYNKNGITCSSSKPVLPAANATNLETLCVCARQSNPPKQSQKQAPRALLLILPPKPLSSGTAFGEIAR